jgi:NADH dehydrogenase
VVNVPEGLARVQARLMELAPGEPLMSRDNLDSMKRDNVTSLQPFTPAPELGIALTPMEAEAPQYLADVRARERFAAYRARARR